MFSVTLGLYLVATACTALAFNFESYALFRMRPNAEHSNMSHAPLSGVD